MREDWSVDLITLSSSIDLVLDGAHCHWNFRALVVRAKRNECRIFDFSFIRCRFVVAVFFELVLDYFDDTPFDELDARYLLIGFRL